MIAFWVYFLFGLAGIGVIVGVIADGIHEGEYKPRRHRKPRLHRKHLPRQPVETRITHPATWTQHAIAAQLNHTPAPVGPADLPGIPPTETPDLDVQLMGHRFDEWPEPQVAYDDTSTNWKDMREQLFAMLDADGIDA